MYACMYVCMHACMHVCSCFAFTGQTPCQASRFPEYAPEGGDPPLAEVSNAVMVGAPDHPFWEENSSYLCYSTSYLRGPPMNLIPTFGGLKYLNMTYFEVLPQERVKTTACCYFVHRLLGHHVILLLGSR